jgi:hypothetical protein
MLESIWDRTWEYGKTPYHPDEWIDNKVWRSVSAYGDKVTDINSLFFNDYLTPNNHRTLAHLNELVSGYWLGMESALLVRKPRVLFDTAGRLHNETGNGVEYPDGWGSYAWHGVRVPETVIMQPDALTRDDFMRERNLEVRRVMQECMGDRFVTTLGGTLLDDGPRGQLWEVQMPAHGPEGVARYVHINDASTPRDYFLQVPPTIQTAEEAFAWTFNMTVEEYRPE